MRQGADFGPGTVRRKAGSRDRRVATGGKGSSDPDLSGRTGFRPGSCERWNPELRFMDRQAEPGFRPWIPPDAGPPASAGGNARVGRRISVRNLPSGEPSGLRPCRGASGETPGWRFGDGRRLRRKRARASVRITCLETSRRETAFASQAGFDAKGQWGLAATPAPINLCARSARARRSSQPRPASWQVG